MAEAKKSTAAEAKKEVAEAKKEAAPEKKMVKIRLFKDAQSDKYRDDVTVGVNGTFYKIQRGVEVEVPEAVAEVLEHSFEQDQNTAMMIERLTQKD